MMKTKTEKVEKLENKVLHLQEDTNLVIELQGRVAVMGIMMGDEGMAPVLSPVIMTTTCLQVVGATSDVAFQVATIGLGTSTAIHTTSKVC